MWRAARSFLAWADIGGLRDAAPCFDAAFCEDKGAFARALAESRPAGRLPPDCFNVGRVLRFVLVPARVEAPAPRCGALLLCVDFADLLRVDFAVVFFAAADLVADFLAAGFFAADFFVADFFVVDFLAADFFAEDFFAAPFLALVLPAPLRELERFAVVAIVIVSLVVRLLPKVWRPSW